jgi:hypothetical protein
MKKLLLILSLVFLFNSCTKTESELTDDQLIDAIIESEERISVAINDLPNTAIASLDVIMPNDVVSSAELAPKLGFEIEMKSWDFFEFELDYERNDNQYFTTNGRRLESSKKDKDGWGNKKDMKSKMKKRGPCFKFVYPISYTMSNGSNTTGNDRKEIHTAMKAFFEINGKTRENKPTLNLPVQILVLDDNKNVMTKDITDNDGLKSLWNHCRGNKNSKKKDEDREKLL